MEPSRVYSVKCSAIGWGFCNHKATASTPTAYDLRPNKTESTDKVPLATDFRLPSTKSPEANRTPGFCCSRSLNA